MDAGSIWIRLGLNSDELRFGLDKAKYSLSEWRDQTNQNSMEMARWGAAIAAEVAPVVAIGAAILDATTKAGAFGKAVKDNARDLGLTTDEYQQWSHVAVAAGGTADEMTQSVRLMTVRMKEAADPTSDMGKQFAALGVKVTDGNGNMRSTNEVLKDVFGALNQLPEGFARNQAQMMIFGKGFSNISDLAGLTREQIQALLDQAPIIDSDKIQKMDEFHNKLALVNKQWELMYAELGTALIPVVEELMPLISDYGIPAIGELATILEYAGRGFHIMGSEAKAAYEIIINHDIGAAKQEMQDLANWIESEQVKIGLKASGYTPGAVWDGSKWVKPTKAGGKAPEVTAEKDKTAEQAEKDRVSALTDVWKEYQDQIKKVIDEKTKLNDLTLNYYEDVQAAGRDVSQIRSLTMAYNRSKRSAETTIATDMSEVTADAARFNSIRSGAALGTIPGTSQYTEAQAKSSGDLIINIDGKQFAKVSGVVSLAGKTNTLSKSDLIQAGVRVV